MLPATPAAAGIRLRFRSRGGSKGVFPFGRRTPLGVREGEAAKRWKGEREAVLPPRAHGAMGAARTDGEHAVTGPLATMQC